MAGSDLSQSDRRIHARLSEGRVVVRYERAGKWWIEGPGGRRQVGVREAAAVAREGEPIFGVSGGSMFDRIVRREA